MSKYGGAATDTWDISSGSATPAKFTDDLGQADGFVAFRAASTGSNQPVLYPQFFESFVKSYEVSGYKP